MDYTENYFLRVSKFHASKITKLLFKGKIMFSVFICWLCQSVNITELVFWVQNTSEDRLRWSILSEDENALGLWFGFFFPHTGIIILKNASWCGCMGCLLTLPKFYKTKYTNHYIYPEILNSAWCPKYWLFTLSLLNRLNSNVKLKTLTFFFFLYSCRTFDILSCS